MGPSPELLSLVDAESALYFYLTVFAMAFYLGMPPREKGFVYKRPSWAPPLAIRAAHELHGLGITAIMLIGCVLAGSHSARESTLLRFAFFSAVFVVDMKTFASNGSHQAFAMLYASAALVLPAGAGRDGVFRAVTVHQLFSSGLLKLRVGGLRWLHPASAEVWMRHALNSQGYYPNFIAENPAVQQDWLLRVLLAHPWLIFAANFAGLAIELGSLPLGLMGGPRSCEALFVLGCALHVGVALLTKITFCFSPAVYAYALLRPAAQDPRCLLAPPAPVAVLVLAVVALFALEDWPFSAMGLFPYNDRQVAGLLRLMDRFALAPPEPAGGKGDPAAGDEGGRAPSVTELCASQMPSVYQPGFIRALGGAVAAPGDEAEVAAAQRRVAAWLRSRSPYLDGETLQRLEALAPPYGPPGYLGGELAGA